MRAPAASADVSPWPAASGRSSRLRSRRAGPRLATNPVRTGSGAAAKTIGVVRVAPTTAWVYNVPADTIRSTGRATSSATMAGTCSDDSARRTSIAMFWPSVYPRSRRPTRNASSSAVGAALGARYPIRGTFVPPDADCPGSDTIPQPESKLRLARARPPLRKRRRVRADPVGVMMALVYARVVLQTWPGVLGRGFRTSGGRRWADAQRPGGKHCAGAYTGLAGGRGASDWGLGSLTAFLETVTVTGLGPAEALQGGVWAWYSTCDSQSEAPGGLARPRASRGDGPGPARPRSVRIVARETGTRQ